MRWILVAILGYAALVIQTAAFRPGGLAFSVDGLWARPDLVLILGVFLALYLDPRDVFIPAWCLGMASDLVSVAGRLGLWAMLFAVTLTGVSAIRRHVNRGRALVQLVLCFFITAGVHLAWNLSARLIAGAPLAPIDSVEASVLDATYTALLAPYAFWLLLRLRSPLRLATDLDEE
jgi:rod shape-determining protein MreD